MRPDQNNWFIESVVHAKVEDLAERILPIESLITKHDEYLEYIFYRVKGLENALKRSNEIIKKQQEQIALLTNTQNTLLTDIYKLEKADDKFNKDLTSVIKASIARVNILKEKIEEMNTKFDKLSLR